MLVEDLRQSVRTLPKLLEVVGRSDDRLVRLLGLAEPVEVNLNHRTLAERIHPMTVMYSPGPFLPDSRNSPISQRSLPRL